MGGICFDALDKKEKGKSRKRKVVATNCLSICCVLTSINQSSSPLPQRPFLLVFNGLVFNFMENKLHPEIGGKR